MLNYLNSHWVHITITSLNWVPKIFNFVYLTLHHRFLKELTKFFYSSFERFFKVFILLTHSMLKPTLLTAHMERNEHCKAVNREKKLWVKKCSNVVVTWKLNWDMMIIVYGIYIFMSRYFVNRINSKIILISIFFGSSYHKIIGSIFFVNIYLNTVSIVYRIE